MLPSAWSKAQNPYFSFIFWVAASMDHWALWHCGTRQTFDFSAFQTRNFRKFIGDLGDFRWLSETPMEQNIQLTAWDPAQKILSSLAAQVTYTLLITFMVRCLSDDHQRISKVWLGLADLFCLTTQFKEQKNVTPQSLKLTYKGSILLVPWFVGSLEEEHPKTPRWWTWSLPSFWKATRLGTPVVVMEGSVSFGVGVTRQVSGSWSFVHWCTFMA